MTRERYPSGNSFRAGRRTQDTFVANSVVGTEHTVELQSLAPSEVQPEVDYSAVSPEHLVLICSETKDESAWAEFIRRFQPLIARVVLRVAREWGEGSTQLVDDLVQETYLKLCAGRCQVLRSFKPTHPDASYAFIKVFTANLVHDHFRLSRSQKRGGAASTISIDAEGAPELSGSFLNNTILERNVLLRQIDACLRTFLLGPNADRDRKIFWLYYRGRFNVPRDCKLAKYWSGREGCREHHPEINAPDSGAACSSSNGS
jgi:RNA polymerase sigma-70 factor (ECF subfamily)